MNFSPTSSDHSILAKKDVLLNTAMQVLEETNFREVIDGFLGESRPELTVRFSPQVQEAIQKCPPELLEQAMLRPEWALLVKEQTGSTVRLQKRSASLAICTDERKVALGESLVSMVVFFTFGLCYGCFLAVTLVLLVLLRPELLQNPNMEPAMANAIIIGVGVTFLGMMCMAFVSRIVALRVMRRRRAAPPAEDIVQLPLI